MTVQCRACLSQNEPLKSIFSKQLNKIYFDLTSIEISKNEIISNKICLDCFKQLNDIQKFKEKCIESNRILSEKLECETHLDPEYTVVYCTNVKLEEINEDVKVEEKNHKKWHSEEKKYQCNECSRRFNTKSELKDHLFSHKEIKSEEKQIECKTERIELKQRKAPTNALKCTYEGCTRVFLKQDRLESHLRFHAGENPDKCDLCSKSFCNNRALKRHMQIHLDIKKYDCRYCEKSFRSSDNRNVHENGVHTKEKTFICHICGQQFLTKTGLISHNNNTHSDERKYHCNECPKSYKLKNELRDHLIRHRGIRDVICGICQATFLVKKDLQIHHKKVHELKKVFKCNECDKQYKQKHQLDHHMRTHTGERPWTCTYCDKGFFDKYTMIKHTYSHTGERPFKCSKCPKAYTEIFILKRHIRQQHSE